MIIGLVGKPSSGKSSFFKAATLIDVKITGIPFTTIKPNIGVGYVIIDCCEKEFGVKCNPKHGSCKNGKRFVPVKLVDVAGLVPGAHEGRGLGNQFLDDLRQASALIHIVDVSGTRDAEGKITSGYDPENDIIFLEKEIDLWFAAVIAKAISKIKPQKDFLQVLTENLSGLEIEKKDIAEALEKHSLSDVNKFATELRKIAKPIIIAANKIDLKTAQENFEKMKSKHELFIPTSAEGEIVLRKAAEKNMVEYIPGGNFTILDASKINPAQLDVLNKIQKEVVEKYGNTGVQTCINKAVFELLDFIAVYPVADASKLTDKDGNVLPDVYLVPKGTTALDLAFKIHTDIGKKFIGAIDARTKKKLGKEYLVKNNDVLEIITSK
jgi:ribosome-binding ATPase YchF (GTP1/OBG family)